MHTDRNGRRFSFHAVPRSATYIATTQTVRHLYLPATASSAIALWKVYKYTSTACTLFGVFNETHVRCVALVSFNDIVFLNLGTFVVIAVRACAPAKSRELHALHRGYMDTSAEWCDAYSSSGQLVLI